MADNRKITVYNDAAFAVSAVATPTTNVVIRQGKAPVVADTDILTELDLPLLTESDIDLII